MSAQSPTVTLDDYLKEVRVFPATSPEFSKIAADLGVSATLASLGPGAALVVAIRNDSGATVEFRILFQVTKNGRTEARDFTVAQVLGPGESMFTAPREVNGLLAGLMHPPGKPGLYASHGSPAGEPLDYYNGATVRASIDSVTLADGTFIGADTQNFYGQLVAEDTAKRSFFNDISQFKRQGLSPSSIQQRLQARKTAADANKINKPPTGTIADLNLAAIKESNLCVGSLMQLQLLGLDGFDDWAQREKTAADAKPTIKKGGN